MLPFSLAATQSCPDHAGLALALAAEFHEVDEGAVEAAFDALGAALAPALPDHPVEQLDELCRTMAAFEALEAPLDPAAVHVDVAIDRLAGHATTLTVVAAEAGRRAGFDVGIVAGRDGHRIGHRALEPADAPWRCGHQVAFALLAELVERAQRTGDLATALRAAELRLDLPLGGAARRRVEHELERMRALLN